MPSGKFKLRPATPGKEIGVFTQPDFARGTSIASTWPVEAMEVKAI